MLKEIDADTCPWQVTWFNNKLVRWEVEFFDGIGEAKHRADELATDTEIVYLSELKLMKEDVEGECVSKAS